MAYDEPALSTKQRGMMKREQEILAAAERILIVDGFFDMSMARIAEESRCPRGTIYRHFASREDIVVALACSVWEQRVALMRRGAAYQGPARIRMAGVGEGFALHFGLCPERFSILYKATDTVCENASPRCLKRLRRAERASVEVVRELIVEAVEAGELQTADYSVDEIVFAYSAQVMGGFALRQLGVPQATMDTPYSMDMLRRSLNVIGDAYGWRPLTKEVDWDEIAADIRRNVFPDETQQVYGTGAWYGKWGEAHPASQAVAPHMLRSQGSRAET